MNNKLFKRIVAAAASAVMLGSCAFATTLSNVGYVDGAGNVGTLSFTYNNGDADKVTYVAYAATRLADGDTTSVVGYTDANGTKYVLGEMVAINQFDNLAAATADKAETVPVDSTKLANADAIVLKSGDSKGSPVAIQAVALQAAPATERTITFANVQEGYATPTLKVADGSLVTDMLAKIADPTKAKGTGDKLDWAFVGWYTDEALTTKLDKSAEAKITADMTLYAKYVQVRIVGDINGDGIVNLTDANVIRQYKAGKLSAANIEKFGVEKVMDNTKYTNGGKDIEYKNGDVNGDGVVNLTDANIIRQYKANKLSDANITKFGIDKPLSVIKD